MKDMGLDKFILLMIRNFNIKVIIGSFVVMLSLIIF